MGNLGAVGPSASAPRSQAMTSYDEVFDGRVSIRKVDDGTFMISAGMRKEPKKGAKPDPYCSTYCPDKEYTADTLKEAFEKAQKLFG